MYWSYQDFKLVENIDSWAKFLYSLIIVVFWILRKLNIFIHDEFVCALPTQKDDADHSMEFWCKLDLQLLFCLWTSKYGFLQNFFFLHKGLFGIFWIKYHVALPRTAWINSKHTEKNEIPLLWLSAFFLPCVALKLIYE